MTMKRIRELYGVPAKRGGRVRFEWTRREGTITGSTSSGLYLRVRFDGERKSEIIHPTWDLEYLDARRVE
jgi:hypothetical protein